MTYGLTQKLIKRTRERFKSGELTHEEAMWFLGLMYSDNKDYHPVEEGTKGAFLATTLIKY